MPQLVWVSNRPVGRADLLDRRSRHKVPVRRVHRHDTVLTFWRKAIGSKPPTTALDGSYWTPKCGEWIWIDDLEEDVLHLRELGVEPVAHLVVVLEAEDDVALLRVLERALDALDGAPDAFARASSPGYRCPVSVRQYRVPRRRERSMAVFCRSTCRARSSGSGCVKFGEKHSIERDLPGLAHRLEHRVDVLGAGLRKNSS